MIQTLSQFYDLMFSTRDARRTLTEQVLAGEQPRDEELRLLADALEQLEAVPEKDGGKLLHTAAEDPILIDISYEMDELGKDLFYLRHDEDAFSQYLAEFHPGIERQVRKGVEYLWDLDYRNLVTDRDGTINNYCGRYQSSIQSVYNAVFFTRFARRCTENAIIVTSAPLRDIGLVNISVLPAGTSVLAGSKGREYVRRDGGTGHFPIDPDKQKRLDEINDILSAMIQEPTYEKFGLIGSGLQLKFGQTTIARQDVHGSVPAKESASFLAAVKNIVSDIDPDDALFRIEDTGTDIEIILTIRDRDSGLKDFDKRDGMEFLDSELKLGLTSGPNLVCGDTGSDIAMVSASMAATNKTRAVFVRNNRDIEQDVRAVCDHTLFVDTPDILITILHELSKKEAS